MLDAENGGEQTGFSCVRKTSPRERLLIWLLLGLTGKTWVPRPTYPLPCIHTAATARPHASLAKAHRIAMTGLGKPESSRGGGHIDTPTSPTLCFSPRQTKMEQSCSVITFRPFPRLMWHLPQPQWLSRGISWMFTLGSREPSHYRYRDKGRSNPPLHSLWHNSWLYISSLFWFSSFFKKSKAVVLHLPNAMTL